MDRYLEIMRRTGLPVIVASGDGEPVIMMPLDAYEALVGVETSPFSGPSAISAPAATPIPGAIENQGPPAHMPAYDVMEENTPISRKTQENKAKSEEAAQSVEDRFFLDPIE